MRFAEHFVVPKIDSHLLLGLAPYLVDEWVGLEFGDDGVLRNPITGTSVVGFRHESGLHDVNGDSNYRVEVTAPIMELPEERQAEFDRRWEIAYDVGLESEDWNQYVHDLTDAKVQVGTTSQTFQVLNVVRDGDSLIFNVDGISNSLRLQGAVDLSKIPKIHLTASGDFTDGMEGEISGRFAKGCFGWFLGKANGELNVDSAALGQGGRRLIHVKATVGRFRVELQIDVESTAQRWLVDLVLHIRARGLGRVLLWLFRKQVRNGVTEFVAEMREVFQPPDDEVVRDARFFNDQIRALLDVNGGGRSLVHLVLWEPDSVQVPEELIRFLDKMEANPERP